LDNQGREETSPLAAEREAAGTLDQTTGTGVATQDKQYVFVCMNVDCKVRGADKVMERLHQRVDSSELPNVDVRPYMCFGGCHDGPNVVVYPDKVWYDHVQEKDADTIVDQHLKQGEPVTALTGKIDKNLTELIFSLLDSGIY
jgi:(2Fe-2S) ferredoxin